METYFQEVGDFIIIAGIDGHLAEFFMLDVAVFALGMLGQEWRQLVWEYLDLCDDEHSHLQEKFLREYVKQFGFTADTVPVFVRGVLSMQNMKYSKDYAAWMANAESLDALLEAKIHLSEIVPSGFSSDEDDDDDEEPTLETESSPEEVLQYAWYSSFALWMALLTSDRAEDSSEYSSLISDEILASHSGLGSA